MVNASGNDEPDLYMRKPFFIKAWLVTPENMPRIAKWCGGQVTVDRDGPYILVPVSRATSRKATMARPGMRVTMSEHNGVQQFKVFFEEWLNNEFLCIQDPIITGMVAATEVALQTQAPVNPTIQQNYRPVPRPPQTFRHAS